MTTLKNNLAPTIHFPSKPEPETAVPPSNNAYIALKKLIKQKGFLDKQPRFLVYKMITNAIMLALSLVVLFSTDNMWLQLLNAVFMAFVFG
jgi:hypothetical protein